MNMKKSVTVLFLLFLFSLSLSLAQHKEKSVEMTPLLTWEMFDSETGVDDTPLLGLKLGFNFSKHLEGEFVYSLGTINSDSFQIINEDVRYLDADEDDDIAHWSANFVFNFKPIKEKFIPYAEGGMGRLRIKRTYNVWSDNPGTGATEYVGRWIDSQSSPSYLFGGGFRYYFKKRFAFRLEVAGVQYHHDVTGLTFDGSNDEYYFTTTDSNLFNIKTSLGFSILFGGKE
ncbi:MAG: outer membrane beta-barrel protein [Acidobacteriota bacterium]